LVHDRPELWFVEPAGTTTVALTSLDEWLATSDLDHVDVVKLDTQGSELDVLRGATEALATVRLLEVEVEFNEMYAGQPLFGDVDRYLRARGFVLWRLKQLVHYGLREAPASSARVNDSQHFDTRPHPFDAEGGQLFWGHAYYVRDDMAFPPEGPGDWQQAVRDACAASAFGFADLTAAVLRRAQASAPASARARLDDLLDASAPAGPRSR
jgi:hypothetical protein